MNINNCILESLKANGKVALPNFGVFYLKRSAAILNAEDGRILPPAQQVHFSKDKVSDKGQFTHQVAQYKEISLEVAQFEVDTQVDYWNKQLEAKTPFNIEGIGQFHLNQQQMVFEGERVETDNTPDFFGLEAINLADITPKHEPTAQQPKKKKNWLWLWIVLFLISAGIFAYVAITNPELIFGEQSELAPKVTAKKTPEIQQTPVVKDTITSDSLTTIQDSLQLTK